MREVVASAPGRVNLIGEHTDYHDGFVMPSAIPQRAHVRARQREDRVVRAVSRERPGAVLEFTLGDEAPRRDWGDYVQGVTSALRQHDVRLANGFDLDIASDVPVGSGLSSSAALMVAVLRAVRELFGLPMGDEELARVAQRGEVNFVGVPVGIMDQMAASLAGEREALFLDTRSLGFERIPIPSELDLVVIDSGISHHHASGGYVTRRRESEAAARLLGVATLRQATLHDLELHPDIPSVLARRARHVITENVRVLAARDALSRLDLPTLGALLNQSHDSLRDDYEVSVPDVDLLVDVARSETHVFGARMTGGGFGGAVVIAAAGGRGLTVAEHITSEYATRARRRATILLTM
jgi:galactokinase